MPPHAIVPVGQIRKLPGVIVEQRGPLLAQLFPALADAFMEMFANAIRNQELRIFRPSVEALRELYFFLAQRLTMGFFRVLPVGSAVADVAVENDERRTILYSDGMPVSVCQCCEIVGIMHVRDVPAVAAESCCDIFAEREIGLAFNGDLIVVVEPTQV